MRGSSEFTEDSTFATWFVREVARSLSQKEDEAAFTGDGTSTFGGVALLAHDSSSWPIGRWANLAQILNGSPPRLEGDLILHESDGPIPEVDQAAWLLERGHMRASSIGFIVDWNSVERILDGDGAWSGGLRYNQSTLVEASLVAVPANPDALVKGPDSRPADELIRFVLNNWAFTPAGRLIRRAEFDRIYAVVGRKRIVSMEDAAKRKRLADRRARDVAVLRAKGQI